MRFFASLRMTVFFNFWKEAMPLNVISNEVRNIYHD